MSDRPVRVRFAPSPTGPLHMGGVRTALYNYLFAKKHSGTFIIRVEDTDQARFVEGAQDYILDAMKWCGIMPTEGPGLGGNYGPYVQSERKGLYRPYAEELVKNEKAYYAFDTSEELTKMRDQAKEMGMPNWQYNSVTRGSMQNSLSLSVDVVQSKIEAGEPYVIRMKMPRNVDVRFNDEIRGWVVVNTNNLDDKVLFKSDGMPTYHLANIVDDYLMKISHVIRGEEWLPSAPLHVMLYDAFGWEAPKFAHLPLLLKPDGNGKLSKRDGDRLGFPVFPTNWTTSSNEVYSGYKEKGYFSGAFINMLALLGWNPGTTQEIFSLDGLVEAFSLERVSKAGAKFDPDKTKWFQQQYLRATENSVLAELLQEKLNSDHDLTVLSGLCGLVKERATFIGDLWEEGSFLIERPTNFDEKTARKKWKGDAPTIMLEFKERLGEIDDFNPENIENVFKSFLEEKSIGVGSVLPQFRLLLSGKGMGPSMFDIASFLGKKETNDRLEIGIKVLATQNA